MKSRVSGFLLSRWWVASLAIGFPLLAASGTSGCATDPPGNDLPPSFNFGGSSASGQGGGASSDEGGRTTSGGAKGITFGGATAAGGSTGGEPIGEECATGQAKANLTPVNMFIQFDRSTSMLQGMPVKWPQAVTALTGFFKDSGSAGLRIALRFFPANVPVAGCGGTGMNQCPANAVQACSEPLVKLGELKAESAPADVQEQLLLDAIAMSAPTPGMMGGFMGGAQQGFPQQMGAGTGGASGAAGGPGTGTGGAMAGAGVATGTPIYPALSGAIEWAKRQKLAAPNEQAVVVLVTDGDASVCNQDIDDIAKLASDGFAMHQIPTYVVGIEGASEEKLHPIAAAGGTTRALLATNGATVEQDLINALKAIRGSAISCDIPMPTAQTAGTTVDPMKINVNLTTTGATMPELIGQTTGATACDQGGWFYDNPTTPTKITLCPTTCMRAQSDAMAKLDIQLGCRSVPIIPK